LNDEFILQDCKDPFSDLFLDASPQALDEPRQLSLNILKTYLRKEVLAIT
jgi:hypothetical protein